MYFAAIGGVFLGAGASTAAATSLGVTIVGGVASTAMTVMQTIGSQKTANVMARAQTNQAITNKQLAEQAMLFEAQGLAEKKIREAAAASQQKFQNKIKAQQTLGTFIAAEADANIGGLTSMLLKDDIIRTELTNEAQIDRNFDYVSRDLDRANQAIYTKAKGRVASMPMGVQPSMTSAVIGGALQIGGDLFARYDKYQERIGAYEPPVVTIP